MAWLFRLLGSRTLEVTDLPEELVIRSTSLGFSVFMALLVAFLFVAVLRDFLRTPKEERSPRKALEPIGVFLLCFLVVHGIGYEDVRLRYQPQQEQLVVERRGILAPLRVQRREIAFRDLDAVRVGHVKVSAPLRNGSPTGPERDGYYIELRTADGDRLQGPRGRTDTTDTITAVTLDLVNRLRTQEAFAGRELDTNVD